MPRYLSYLVLESVVRVWLQVPRKERVRADFSSKAPPHHWRGTAASGLQLPLAFPEPKLSCNQPPFPGLPDSCSFKLSSEAPALFHTDFSFSERSFPN